MDNLAKLGIDLWSILLYMVNYGILLAVLGFFLYPKIRKAIQQRKESIRNNINEAENLRKELEKTLEDSKAEKENLLRDLKQEKSQMEERLHEQKTTLIQEMEEKRANMLEETRKQIEDQKAELLRETEMQMIAMVERVILSILSQSMPEKVIKDSVEKAWKSELKR